MLLNFCAWYTAILVVAIYLMGIPISVAHPIADDRIGAFVRMLIYIPVVYFVAAHLPL